MNVRLGTERTIVVGPILDTDGAAKTDEVVASVLASKNGGNPTALNGSATLTHKQTGFYLLLLTTSDIDTLGCLEITLNSGTNSMPIRALNVMTAAAWDAMYAASGGYVPADMTHIYGTALTETATQLAGAFTKFFDVASPTGTVNSLPAAVAGAASGLPLKAVSGDFLNVANLPQVAAGGVGGVGDTVRIGGITNGAVNCGWLFNQTTAISNLANDYSGTGYAGGTIRRKVDVDTLKTRAITCAAGVTFGVYVGGTAAHAIATDQALILEDTNEMQTDLADGGRIDLILDDIDAEVDDIHIAVNAITVTGSALNVVCEADGTYTVVTTGNEGATTYANTYSNNSIRHEVAAVGGTIDTRYQFDIGSSGVPVAVIINAHFARNPAGGITMDLWAWNFVANDWEIIHANVLPAANTTTDGDYNANLFAHNVSGGKVRLRFYKTGVGTASLNIDQVFVSYAESVATNIGLIKAKTDSLTFTVAGDVDANVQTWKGATAPAMTGDAYAQVGIAGAGLSAIPDMATATALAAAQTDLDTITDDGINLAATGLDAISTTSPSGDPSTWTYAERQAALWLQRFSKSVHDSDAGTITLYDTDGSSVICTQTATATSTTETLGVAS